MSKCLSLKRPWAALVVLGIKPVENRGWNTFYRGPLIIHASQTWDEQGARWILDKFPELIDLIRHSVHHKGSLVGRVEMIACVKYSNSEWFFGPYGYIFRNPVEFAEPIPYKGQLGIFEVEV